MKIGACDCCNAQDVEISFTVFAGLETWACTDGCKPVCAKRRNLSDEWICDRCGSFWWDTLLGPEWRPLSCPDRQPITDAPERNRS